jgi:hypothetical protein
MKMMTLYKRIQPLLISLAIVAAMIATAAGTKWH